MKKKYHPQSIYQANKYMRKHNDKLTQSNKTQLTTQKGVIRNWKHGTVKNSPLRLKIIRSRETSPVIQNSLSQTKIMGNISINKIKFVKGKNKRICAGLKPVTATISLWEKSTKLKKPHILQSKNNNEINKNWEYFEGVKHVELSFEEEIDVDNIYNGKSILNEQNFKQSKRLKMHRRKISEFEEEGKENLSSEGDEHDTKETYIAKPPKIQQEKFNDLNKKFSRNPEISQLGNFKTDIPIEGSLKMHSQLFSSQKTAQDESREEANQRDQNNFRRSIHKSSKIPHNINRSRNAGRNTHSNDSSNWELVTSWILNDKLKNTLKHSRKEGKKINSKIQKNFEKDLNQENLKKKYEIKEKIYVDSHSKKVHKATYDRRRVNNQILGNIIKNNINDLSTKNPNRMMLKESKNAEFNLRSNNKFQRIHNKNIKNHSLNNKENYSKNNKANGEDNDFHNEICGTEVYNLNQYWSEANLNAFGNQNFSLPQNMILSKNRSRDVTGFGSPTLRKIEGEKEKSKGAFDNIMAKHGLLKDLNNLNSFNAFWKQSPLRHQRSLDYCYQSTNSSLYPSHGHDPTHLKTCTQKNFNFYSRKENIENPISNMSQFSPTGTLQHQHDMGGRTMDSNTPSYSFPFQRRARSASPPKDPEINDKIAASLSPRHPKEKKTSAVDDLLEDQIMGLQDPLQSLNSIHSRIGSGSFKSRKPIIANTKLFFIGGPSHWASSGDEVNQIPSDKMKVLSKAINHYLNGEYGKISENQDDNKLIENNICTHDLKGHAISDGNEHDLTDEGLTKKWEVDDWLEDKSGPNENSLEGKQQDGFDPFSCTEEENYESQRSLYKNQRNKQSNNEEITNENIMKIIKNSQRQTDNIEDKNHKYVSLTGNDEEIIEKNIIVDDADLELVDCLEGEEWKFQNFNTKKKLEAQREQKEIEERNLKITASKPPQPAFSANQRLRNLKEESKNPVSSEMVETEVQKPRRKRKSSKHRRTESITFDKDFIESLEENCPN